MLTVAYNLQNMVVFLRGVHFNMIVYNNDFYKDNPTVNIETIYPSVSYYNDIISSGVVSGYNGLEEDEL